MAETRGRWDLRGENWWMGLSRLILAGVFLWSGWHKTLDPIAFIIKVNEYEILPTKWVEPFALALPWLMIVTSGLLVVGLLTRPAAAGQALMLLSFIVAVSVNIYRDKVMGCGCFSEQGSQIGWGLVMQDFCLLGRAVVLVLKGGGGFSLDGAIGRRLARPRPATKEEEDQSSGMKRMGED